MEPQDYRELAECFQVKTVDAGTTIMNYGDRVDNFYMLLKGTVKSEICNETITDWNLWAGLKNALDDWKNVEFDTMMKHWMLVDYQEYRREHETQIEAELYQQIEPILQK